MVRFSGALFSRFCLARAPLPISLASRISAAAPLFKRPITGPLVSRSRCAACAAALVAHASRALVSRGRRALRAAVLVARASHADFALALRSFLSLAHPVPTPLSPRTGAVQPLSSPLHYGDNEFPKTSL